MSNTQVVAIKLALKHHIKVMQELGIELEKALCEVPDLSSRITAVTQKEFGWEIESDFEVIKKNLNIFHQFKYKADQDPKEAIRFPAVIQLSPTKHEKIYRLVYEINSHKDALAEHNAELKELLGRKSNAVWQDILTFASVIQILRHISVLDGDFNYLGLSYLTKPVVKTLDKERALCYLDNKKSLYLDNPFYFSRLSFLDEIAEKVAAIDTSAFDIKMARQGAPRMMLNAHSVARNYQVMASMPVFLFSESRLNVGLPRGEKRRSRCDKRIPIGEVPSDFGLYLVPHQIN